MHRLFASPSLRLLLLAKRADLRVYRNTGGASFVDEIASRVPGGERNVEALAAGDVDSDGGQDLLLSIRAQGIDALYANDGQGHYVDVTAVGASAWTS